MDNKIFFTGKFNYRNYSNRAIFHNERHGTLYYNDEPYSWRLRYLNKSSAYCLILNPVTKTILLSQNNRYSSQTATVKTDLINYINAQYPQIPTEQWRVRIFHTNFERSFIREQEFSDVHLVHHQIWRVCTGRDTRSTFGNLNRSRSRVRNQITMIEEKFKYLEEQINENITFGVEFEFSATSYSDVLTAFRNHGLNVKDRHREYGRSSTREWVLCYDGSIHTNEDFSASCELTTPILKGKGGLLKLYRYMMVLKELHEQQKIRVNKSCGTHTHFGNLGVIGETTEDIFKLYEFYSSNEKLIDSVLPESRRQSNNHYCQALERFTDEYDRLNEKYIKICLKKFTMNGTFENRHHSGTISFEKIVNWIIFNQRIIEAVNDIYAINYQDLTAMLLALNLKTKSIEYFISRKVVLNDLVETYREGN